MEKIGSLLQGLSSIVWPLIVFFVLVRFGGTIKAVLESARGRKFTIKIPGSELTMEEASEQQRLLIGDLQQQVVEIQKRFEAFKGGMAPKTVGAMEPDMVSPKGKTVLWVDDQPKNNAYLIASLSEQGVEVTTATSTANALSRFASKHFDRVISDLGRREGRKYNPVAGIELTKQIRAMGSDAPIVIYTSSEAAQKYEVEAHAAGVKEITSSPTVLLNALDFDLL